ncbi:F-box/WD repeat-containing protein 4 isoform X1 [Anopheles bellator]|uniref:F-box/WD repeat-containing protein 4 isoform X1 n=1 Tax=Anopheles bellator TaxID=139047 RepID=UPI00264888A6|nr:F-box/WD repeat-containing protein 4 isoform X1 [Anopheles bellator]
MWSESHQHHAPASTSFYDLDEYSLAHVFLFLSVDDLDRCLLVCKKFQHIIQRFVYPKKSMKALVTGSGRDSGLSRHRFTFRKRVKLNENWCDGRYEEHTLFHHNAMYISQMAIDRDWLYMTHGGRLQAHQRTKTRHLIDSSTQWEVGFARDADITSLARHEDHFFAGRMDGKVMIYVHNTRQKQYLAVARDTINAVDFNQDVYAITTRHDATYFINRSLPDSNESEYLEELELNRAYVHPQAYETIKLNGHRLAAGKFHCSRKQALQLIDLYSCVTMQLNSQSLAVYDVVWKDDNCMLTGNFDDSMRLVDIRTGNDEACWRDPYNASVYCLSFNGGYAVHCGMKYHHRSNLYDLRVPNNCIQMYFPSKRKHTSPVYGIAADLSQLFLVTDHNLRILNFDADWAAKKDYAAI